MTDKKPINLNYILDSFRQKIYPQEKVDIGNNIEATLVYEKLPTTKAYAYYFKVGCRNYVNVKYFTGTFQKLGDVA